MSTDIKTVNLCLAIPPRKIGSEKSAIKEKLNGLISQYIPEADGILIKWNDLDIINKNGIITDDQPYTFWKVRFIAHVFKPIEGKLIEGLVSRIFKQYFVVKTMGSFAATVTIPEALSKHPAIENLSVDQEVYFRFKGISEGAYRGELDEECAQLTWDLVERRIDGEKEQDAYEYAKDFQY